MADFTIVVPDALVPLLAQIFGEDENGVPVFPQEAEAWLVSVAKQGVVGAAEVEAKAIADAHVDAAKKAFEEEFGEIIEVPVDPLPVDPLPPEEPNS